MEPSSEISLLLCNVSRKRLLSAAFVDTICKRLDDREVLIVLLFQLLFIVLCRLRMTLSFVVEL